MKAAELFVNCLENEGVEFIFGVPGEENVDIMDALIESPIRFIDTSNGYSDGESERRIGAAGPLLRDASIASAPVVNPSKPGTWLEPADGELAYESRRVLVEIPVGQQAVGAVVGEVVPHPRQEHRDAVAEPDEEQQVQAEPRHPGGEATEATIDSPPAADTDATAPTEPAGTPPPGVRWRSCRNVGCM